MFSIVRPLVMSLTKSPASIFTRVFSRKKNWSIFFLYRTLQCCIKFYAGSQSTLCHCLNTAFFCSVSSRSQICTRYFRLISIFNLREGEKRKILYSEFFIQWYFMRHFAVVEKKFGLMSFDLFSPWMKFLQT